MAKSILKNDKQGICLLCQHENCTDRELANEGDSDAKWNSSGTAIKMLLRYLNLDITELVPNSSPLPVPASKSESELRSVNLCAECSSVAHVFLGLFRAFEAIRLQLDKCVRDLLQVVEKGEKNVDGNYEESVRIVRKDKRESGECSKTQENSARIADQWRKETIKKVCRKVKFSAPRVSLQKLSTDSNTTEQPEPPQNIYEDDAEDNISLVSSAGGGDDEDMDEDDFGSYDAKSKRSAPDSDNTTNSQTEEVTIPVSTYLVKCFHCEEGFPSREKLEMHNREKHTKKRIPGKAIAPVFPIRQKESRDWTAEEIEIESLDGDEGMDVTDDYGSSEEAHNIQVYGGDSEHMEVRSKKGRYPSPLHPLRTIKSPPWTCNYCDKEVSFRGSLEHHQISHHAASFLIDEGRLPPSISEEELDAALEYFLRQVSNSAVACPICRKEGFQGKYQVRPHLLHTHTHDLLGMLGWKPVPPNKNFLVDIIGPKSKKKQQWRCSCGKYFNFVKHSPSIEELMASVAPQHSEEVRSNSSSSKRKRKSGYKCTLCEKVMPSMWRLNNHHSNEHPGMHKAFPCEYCDKSFSLRFNLTGHLISGHPARYFRSRIPADVSEEAILKTVDEIIRKCRKIPKPNPQASKPNSRRNMYCCPTCQRMSQNLGEMKVHITRDHLETIIEAASNIKSRAHFTTEMNTENIPDIPEIKQEQIPEDEFEVDNNCEEFGIDVDVGDLD